MSRIEHNQEPPMYPRPSSDTLRSLRITLQKLEQNFEVNEDASAMTELKRILLNRISELEVVSSLESRNGHQNGDHPAPADLSELPALVHSAAIEVSKETADKTDPEKLD
jgi:hypothetical protein